MVVKIAFAGDFDAFADAQIPRSIGTAAQR
jgi:hypothetical protein